MASMWASHESWQPKTAPRCLAERTGVTAVFSSAISLKLWADGGGKDMSTSQAEMCTCV